MDFDLKDVGPDDLDLLFEMTREAYYDLVNDRLGAWRDEAERPVVHEKRLRGRGRIAQAGAVSIPALPVEDGAT